MSGTVTTVLSFLCPKTGDHREAAAFLKRISMVTFRQLVTQLPTDVFVDCLPQSLPLLEVNSLADSRL